MSYIQSPASFLTPETIRLGVSVGPDENDRRSLCPVARILTELPPTSTAITALTTQATNTETVEGSAEVVLQGFAAQVQTAVAAALAADDAADQGSIAAANTAIAAVTARFVASAGTLGTAITANTPAAPAAPVPAV